MRKVFEVSEDSSDIHVVRTCMGPCVIIELIRLHICIFLWPITASLESFSGYNEWVIA